MAAEILEPFPFNIPVIVVFKVIAGVVVEFATVPEKPFAVIIDKSVTVPLLVIADKTPYDKVNPEPIDISSILPFNAELLPKIFAVDIVWPFPAILPGAI